MILPAYITAKNVKEVGLVVISLSNIQKYENNHKT